MVTCRGRNVMFFPKPSVIMINSFYNKRGTHTKHKQLLFLSLLLWTIVSRVLWTFCFALLCFVFTWVKCWLPEQQICHMTKSTAIDIETIALKRHSRMQVSVRALSCAVFHWQVGKAIGNRESWQPCHMSVTL